MFIHKYSILSLLAASVPLAAQNQPCSRGPGTLFGIVAYQCANCGFQAEIGNRPTYFFYAEPLVTKVEKGAPVAVGDVIEAVDGKPITTQAGADQFSYPPLGEHVLTVRRGRDRQELRINLDKSCHGTTSNTSYSYSTASGGGMGGRVASVATPGSGGGAATARSGGGSGSGGGASTAVISGGFGAGGSGPLIVVDGVVQGNLRTVSPVDAAAARFGFGLGCRPTCSMNYSREKGHYYTFSGYPPIIAVREGSAADRAGIRVGDLVIKVNGRSILEDDGWLQRIENQNELRLTLRREGTKGDIEVNMLVTR